MNIRNFKLEEDRFFKNAHGVSKIYDEVLLLMKILQTKTQVKKMKIEYYK